MVSALVFLIVGLIMILLEFFLPGGVMGVAGALFVVVGLIVFAVTSPSVPLTIGVFVITIVLLLVLGKMVLKNMQKSRFFLSDDQEGYKASSFAKEMIGKQGVVVADLKPAGHVEIEGERYQAVSRMGYINHGTSVEVIGGEGAHLIVKKIEEKNDTSD